MRKQKLNTLFQILLSGLILISWHSSAQDLQFPKKDKKGYQNNLQNTMIPEGAVTPQPRIVGGSDADIANFPFMVSITLPGFDHFCGGSVIDENWILTAAHCWDTSDPGDLTVRAGFTALSSSDGQFRAVEEIIIHPGWDAGGSASQGEDIALLRLATPLDLSDPNVEIIAYATAPDLAAGLTDPGVTSTITGWGALSSGGSSPDILQFVEVPIVSNEEANEGYGGSVVDDMIAAGIPEGGIDSCQGDSGGPMVVPNANGTGFIQAGIVSWGNGCASPGFPGIYTRVTFYEDWIIENSGVRVNQYPGLIISEFSDGTNPGGTPKFLEIHNANTTQSFNLDNVMVKRYANGGETSADFDLPDFTLAPGETYVIAGADYSAESWYATVFAIEPNVVDGTISGNGDDVYALYDNENGRTIDAYGVVGTDGTGEFWEYTDQVAVRNPWVVLSNSGAFLQSNFDEWMLSPYADGTVTPGTHQAQVPAGDIAITSIEGVSEGETIAVCDGDFTDSPQIVIQNRGTAAANSVTIESTLNGAVTSETITLTTPLEAGSGMTLTLAEVDFVGPNSFSYSVKVTGVNGGEDGNPTNDMQAVNFSIATGDGAVSVAVTTDNYPEETSWEITNTTTGEIIAGDGPFADNFTTYESGEICLNNGYYEVSLLDSFGDGGSELELFDAAGNLMFTLVLGPDDSGQSASFCIGCYEEVPENLTAAATSTSTVELNWEFSGTAPDGFTIYSASNDDPETFASIGTVESGSTSATIENLDAFSKYFFFITAVDNSFALPESNPSNTVAALTLPGTNYYQDFEEHDAAEGAAAGFQFVDADADGDIWFTNVDEGIANSGAQIMGSFSAINGFFGLTPFTPENYMVLPQLAIDAESPMMKFYVSSFVPGFSEDYSVLVSTTGYDLADFTEVYSESIEEDSWVLREIDLSEFAGQDVFIALVHKTQGNTTSQFVLLVDDIAVDGTIIVNENSVDVVSVEMEEEIISCSNPTDFQPTITFRNEGFEPVSEVTVVASYTSDATGTVEMPAQTLTIGQPIGYFESATFELASLGLTEAGEYSIDFTVTSVNGTTDLTPENNTVSSMLDLGFGEYAYTLNLLTDAYPGETSWAIVDVNTNAVIYEGAPGEDDEEVLVSFDICLTDGAYALIVNDAFGDGMGGFFGSPIGNIEFLDENGATSFELAGDGFDDQAVHLFCVGDGCLDNSAALVDLSMPEAYSSCETPASIIPAISILNEGNVDITSIDVLVGVSKDGAAPTTTTATITLEEALGSFEFADLDLAAIEFTESGEYMVTVKVLGANGETDASAGNNIETADISIEFGDAQYAFNLLTDGYPGETTWEIVNNGTGNLVFTGDPSDAETLIEYDLCFSNGSYTLTVFDSFNDGMGGFFGSPIGNIEMLNENGELVFELAGDQFSDQVSFDFCVGGDCPDVPTDFVATTISDSQIDLSWAFAGTNDGFVLFRSKSETSGYVKIADLDAASTTFSNSGLVGSTQYFYRLHAANTGIVSDPIFTSATTSESDLGEVVVGIEEGFESGVPPEGWIMLDSDGDGNNWTDITNTTFTDRPDVVYAGDISAGSASWAGEPLTPDNWIITPAVEIKEDFIFEYWISGFNEDWFAEVYGVYISETGTEIADFTEVFKEELDTEVWQERSIDISSYVGKTIHIAFRHYDVTDQNFLLMDDIYVGTPKATLSIAAPANVTATPVGIGGITLGWEYDRTADVDIKIYRSETGEADSFEWIGDFSPSITNHNDTGLTPGTEYFYEILAENATGASTITTVSATAGEVSPIAGFSGVAESYTKINLSWDAYTDEFAYLTLWTVMVDGENTVYTPVTTLNFNETAYSVSGIQPETSITYAITATTADGFTSNPEEVTVATQAINLVQNLAVTILSRSVVEITWDQYPYANATLVLTRTEGDNTIEVARISGEKTTFAESGLDVEIYQYYMTVETAEGFVSGTVQAEVNLITGLVDEFNGAQLSVYPNPTNGKVNINISDRQALAINVYNQLGKLVKTVNPEGSITSTEFSVDLAGMAKGVYFLRISSGSAVTTSKIVLK